MDGYAAPVQEMLAAEKLEENLEGKSHLASCQFPSPLTEQLHLVIIAGH